MRTERGNDVIIMLVGNKTDLSDKRYSLSNSCGLFSELKFHSAEFLNFSY